jgi:phytoene synthase|tara:strand:+ start:524 stop:1546 length:1023 start_codon:yes stop_codon:yes gene_type:complete
MNPNFGPIWRPGSLSGADGTAEAIAAKDFNNLYRTSCFFVDPERYRAFCALYAIMRVVDDRVDEVLAQGCPKEEAILERTVLDAWQRLVEATLSQKSPNLHDLEMCRDPRAPELFDAFSRAYKQFPVKRQLWDNFFDAMGEDLRRTRFETYSDFVRYAQGATVAPTTVYLYLIASERSDNDEVFRVASDFMLDSCGQKLGLFAYIVHVLRDLRRDLETGKTGLLYLAGDDMAHRGVNEQLLATDLAAGRASQPLKDLVRDLVDRAQIMLEEGKLVAGTLQNRLSPDRLFVLELIIRIYSETIAKIIACSYDLMTEQHRLTTTEKESLARDVALRTLSKFS